MILKIRSILLIVILGVSTPVFSNTPTINVVVSILPQVEWVKSIGGNTVSVSVMIPPGASPAVYEPSPKQLKDLSKADLYIQMGLPFEKAHMKQFRSLNPSMKVVDLSIGTILDNGEHHGDLHDPHTWLSPRRVRQQIQIIAKALISMDPQFKKLYLKNLKVYEKKLNLLDTKIQKQLKNIKRKKFLVFHPVFGYFAQDYGLEQFSIEFEGKDPTPKHIQSIIRLAQTEKIRVIFVQKQFGIRLPKIIAKAIGGQVIVVDPLAPNYVKNIEEIAENFSIYLND